MTMSQMLHLKDMRAALALVLLCFITSIAYTFHEVAAATEQPPLVYENLPFPTKTPAVHAGDVIPLYVVRHNLTGQPLSYITSHEVRDENGTHHTWVLPSLDVVAEPGYSSNTSLINHTLDSIPPGEYTISGRATIPGKYKTFYVDWRSSPFRIAPADEPLPPPEAVMASADAPTSSPGPK